MNIALVHLRDIGNVSGGLEKVMINFANEMNRRGHHVSVIVYDRTGKLPFYPIEQGVNFINLAERRCEPVRMPFLKKLSREWARTRGKKEAWYEEYRGPYIIPSLREVYEEICPDILIVQYFTSIGLVQASNPPCPVWHMFHGVPLNQLSRASANEVAAISHCALLQTLTPKYRDSVKERFPDRKVVCVPNIVPQQDEIAELEMEKGKYHIIHAGRLDLGNKRQDLLIRAFASVAEKFPDWEVYLWGDGKGKEKLKALIQKLHMENRVFLCGTTSQIMTEYKKSDLIVFPSKNEGWGLALTEAMSCGLPAVGYKSCGAVNEIIEDGKTGYLVEDGVEPLAEAMRKLMGNQKLRVQMGQAAHESMKRFAPEKVWDTWENLLKTHCEKTEKNKDLNNG